jgi:hypothetical protein
MDKMFLWSKGDAPELVHYEQSARQLDEVQKVNKKLFR